MNYCVIGFLVVSSLVTGCMFWKLMQFLTAGYLATGYCNSRITVDGHFVPIEMVG